MEKYRYIGFYTNNYNNQSYDIHGDNSANVVNNTLKNAIHYSNFMSSYWYVVDTKTNLIINGGNIINNKNHKLNNEMKSYLNSLYYITK